MDKRLPILELHQITKSFKKTLVFENIDLQIFPGGSITGVIGPNGAGKSMLLRIICGLIKPTRGEVVVLGSHVGVDCDFPPKTGALIDIPGFLPAYTAQKNLKILAEINGTVDQKRIDEVLSIVGLDKKNSQPVSTYSVGMRKRLGIAQAVLEEPELLLLDEPTDSIDQAGWKNVYEYLIQLKEKGTTILFTSNNMDEITILCDQTYLLDKQHLTAVVGD